MVIGTDGFGLGFRVNTIATTDTARRENENVRIHDGSRDSFKRLRNETF